MSIAGLKTKCNKSFLKRTKEIGSSRSINNSRKISVKFNQMTHFRFKYTDDNSNLQKNSSKDISSQSENISLSKNNFSFNVKSSPTKPGDTSTFFSNFGKSLT